MATPVITSLTLPSSWTAATPSACPNSNSDEYWIWDSGNGAAQQDTVLGGPSQTTNGCLPPNWDGHVTYIGSECPSGYASACGGTQGSAYTCCPTAYTFSCAVPASDSTYPNVYASTFRCISQYASSHSAPITRWTMQQGPAATSVQTLNLTSPLHLFALAVLYVTPTSTLSDASSTASSGATSASSSGAGGNASTGSNGLGVGASAGIGIGVGLGLVLVALLGWMSYRKRASRRSRIHSSKRPSKLLPVVKERGDGAITGPVDAHIERNNAQADHTTDLSELPEHRSRPELE